MNYQIWPKSKSIKLNYAVKPSPNCQWKFVHFHINHGGQYKNLRSMLPLVIIYACDFINSWARMADWLAGWLGFVHREIVASVSSFPPFCMQCARFSIGFTSLCITMCMHRICIAFWVSEGWGVRANGQTRVLLYFLFSLLLLLLLLIL